MSHDVFLNPNHDHFDCKSKIMAYAERFCTAHKLRLTKLRRDILLEVAGNHKAIGAYQILDNFAARGQDLAPISVYRSLDFLQSAGLIHRLDSINAYFACQRILDGGSDRLDGQGDGCEDAGCGASETLIFLICDQCGVVGEVRDGKLDELIPGVAKVLQFTPRTSQMEIGGLCRFCSKEAQ